MMMYKKIISFAIVLSLLSVFSYSLLFSEVNNKIIDEDLNATEKPDHIVLTWSDDPATTQTISYRAKSSISWGLVKYREYDKTDGDYLIKKPDVELFTTVLGDSRGRMNIFSATLTGLKPGTKYIYSVACGNNSSTEYSFSTAAKHVETFKFLIFGDSQSGYTKTPNYKPWQDTVNNAFKQNGDAKFIINVGDMVEIGQIYSHWNKWFDAARDVISFIPAVPIMGNHETYTGLRLIVTKPYYFTRQFKIFQNGPEGLKGQVYSFDYGAVHFSVLDSQLEEESPHYGDILKDQTEWLNRDLSSTRQTWKLVFFHKSPYNNSPFSINEAVKTAFCPIIDKHHVDMVFNGHDHALARTYPIKHDKLYSDPKNGTVYYKTGRSGAKSHSFLVPNSRDAFFYNPKEEPCYESVTINKNTLRIVAYTQNGAILDSYTIEK